MRNELRLYLESLINDVPHVVYVILLFILLLGSVTVVAFNGKKALGGVARLLLIEYVFLIYSSTVLFRTLREVRSYNYTPFWSYNKIFHGDTTGLLAENIMNVVVFVPVGFLLSCVSRSLKWWKVLLIGSGISFSLEILQLVFKRGFSEFDDVFHNTLGCAIGIMIVALIKGLWKFCSFLFVPQWGRKHKGQNV